MPGGGWGGRGFEFVLSIYDIYRYPMGTIYIIMGSKLVSYHFLFSLYNIGARPFSKNVRGVIPDVIYVSMHIYTIHLL